MNEWILLVAIVASGGVTSERFGPYPNVHECRTAMRELHHDRAYGVTHDGNPPRHKYHLSCIPQPRRPK